jgi:transglutaminase/protease-like cytokinesis protein 3
MPLDHGKDLADGVGGGERTRRVPVAGVTLTCEGFEHKKRAMREAGLNQDAIDEQIGKKLEVMSIRVGERWALTAIVDPQDATDKRVTWKSSNRWVAGVSANGVVKGRSYGYATITATTADGGMSDTCRVAILRDIVD